MQLTRLNGIRLYGSVWFGAGLMLLSKGILLLCKQTLYDELPLIDFLKSYTGSRGKATAILLFIGLIIGLLKGRLVLAKTATKIITRLSGLSDPISIRNLFTLRYCLILLLMISLGAILRFSPLPDDIHGFIDFAIGSALISGSLGLLHRGALKNFVENP